MVGFFFWGGWELGSAVDPVALPEQTSTCDCVAKLTTVAIDEIRNDLGDFVTMIWELLMDVSSVGGLCNDDLVATAIKVLAWHANGEGGGVLR